MVMGEHHAVDLERELLEVEVITQVSLRDGRAGYGRDELEPVALVPDQCLPQRTWLVVELGGGCDEDAPALESLVRPLEPAV